MATQTDVDRDLLAAVRRASGDEQLTFDGSPRPLNTKGSVMLVELRASMDNLEGTAVVRICPDGDVATREATIHRVLADQGFPVPGVLLTGSADDELDGAWLLIEHVAHLAERTSGWGRAVERLGSLTALLRRPALLADLAARLHSVDPDPLQAALGQAACDFDWYGYQWGLVEMLSGTGHDEVIDWLAAHRPVDSVVAVSHGDLHPSNIVVGSRGPSVIDWGIGGLAPAARDVACAMFALLNTGGRAPAPARPFFNALGRFLSRDFLRLYQRRKGSAMTNEELEWHRVLYSVNRILWATVAMRAGLGAGALVQERPLHRRLIKDITGIDIA